MRNIRFKLSLKHVAVFAALTVLSACGGSEDPFVTSTTTATSPAASVASLQLTTSTPTLPSDGSATATITAYALDSGNRFLANVPVTFSTSSGGLSFSLSGSATTPVTSTSGAATATLSTPDDPENRTITVTATAGSQTATVTVAVTGTRLSIQGAAALVIGETATYTVALINSANVGIPNTTVKLSSAASNALSASTLTTDANGNATFTLTASNSGTDTLTASALNISAKQSVSVNADSFTFTTPASNANVNIGTSTPVTVHWLSNNTPVVGQTVSFATTRGTLSSPSAVTDANGNATVNISSTNAGGATLTATASGTATTQETIEFVATTAASIDLQPSQFTVAPAGQSTLTAVVRDAANNLVKNKTVTFSVQDVTGGTLSVASAVTDSEGTAQSVYTAGSTTSAQNGVVITATVQGTSVSTSVDLTVATEALFVTIGTGNKVITNSASTQYSVVFAIQVNDANGAGVPNTAVSVSLWPTQYYKGYRIETPPSAPTGWGTNVTASCANEDVNRNGILDPGEDLNGNGKLDPGSPALVTPQSVTTDSTGNASVTVEYPEQYAYYVQVQLTASATVQGTEYSASQTFVLEGAVADFDSLTVAPPGTDSPYGIASVCTNPN